MGMDQIYDTYDFALFSKGISFWPIARICKSPQHHMFMPVESAKILQFVTQKSLYIVQYICACLRIGRDTIFILFYTLY